jgi:transposase
MSFRTRIKLLWSGLRRHWGRLHSWWFFTIYLPIFRPRLNRIHCEAIQTLLRDIGYVDRSERIEWERKNAQKGAP